MKAKSKILAMFAAAVLVVLAVSMVGASERYQEVVDDEGNVLSVDELMADALALEKEALLYRRWAGGAAHFEAFEVDFPEFFGGSYVNEKKQFVIQVTTLNECVVEYFSEIIDTDGVVFEEVKYSMRTLLAFQDAVLRMSQNTIGCSFDGVLFGSISGTGLALAENAVVVTLSENRMRTLAEPVLKSFKELIESENYSIRWGNWKNFVHTSDELILRFQKSAAGLFTDEALYAVEEYRIACSKITSECIETNRIYDDIIIVEFSDGNKIRHGTTWGAPGN
ncbi:MAG: hypothetical protein FWD35_03180, partial [Oscillospiraceae bacterium]|nr:hypothetical protein [Oscillospiraceae bacterium]